MVSAREVLARAFRDVIAPGDEGTWAANNAIDALHAEGFLIVRETLLDAVLDEADELRRRVKEGT